MCKRYIYLRVSTCSQTFEQQMQDIKNYGINPNEVDGIVKEHESGAKSYVDREFQKLMKRCKEGDIIYAGSTDRLGRNFLDMIDLMKEAKNRGITIIACKQNLSLADDNPMAKIVILIATIFDEDERMRIKNRTKNKKAWQREQIEKYGYFVIENGPNAGMPCSYVGSPKGRDTTDMRAAAIRAKSDQKAEWKLNSVAYKWVMDKVAQGVKRNEIIAEFNKLYALQPDVFCTRTGKPLTKGLLSNWIREANPLAL